MAAHTSMSISYTDEIEIIKSIDRAAQDNRWPQEPTA